MSTEGDLIQPTSIRLSADTLRRIREEVKRRRDQGYGAKDGASRSAVVRDAVAHFLPDVGELG